MRYSWVLIGICLVSAARAQRDSSVCEMTSPSGRAPPMLPNSFVAQVEESDQSSRYTRTARVAYDYDQNAAIVIFMDFGYMTEGRLYKYNTTEYIAFNADTGDCSVRRLGADSIFGMEYVDGRPHIAAPNKVFNFGDGSNPTQFIGPASVRGIATNQWYSCIYNDATKETYKAYWDVSDSSKSILGQEGNEVPMKLTIAGKRLNEAGRKLDVNKHYHYFNFQYFDSPQPLNKFQVPAGIYCPGMKKTMEKPNPKDAFRFRQETVEPTIKVTSSMSEWYDFTNKLVRFDYKPVFGGKWGYNPIKQVHDFNTGVAYVLDKIVGNCTAMPISASSTDAVRDERNRQLVRIKTVSEMFHLNLDYTYMGESTVREIKCDKWIATMRKPEVNSTYVYEWHFSKKEWADGSTGSKITSGIPVMLRTIIKEYEFPIEYHFYDYVEEKPDVWSYHIGACYRDLRRIDYRFEITGDFSVIVAPNPQRFRYFLLAAVMRIANGVSPLRINDLQIRAAETSGKMIVQFNLLDVAPVQGDTANTRPEVPLETASKALNDAIKDYKFIVYWKPDEGSSVIELPAIPNSLVVSGVRQGLPDTKPGKGAGGYSSGAMAALALGMIVLGILAGTAVTYWLFFIRT